MDKTIIQLWNEYLSLVDIIRGVISEHGILPDSYWNPCAQSEMQVILANDTNIDVISKNQKLIIKSFRDLWDGLSGFIAGGNNVSRFGPIENIDLDYLTCKINDYQNNPVPGKPSKQYYIDDFSKSSEIIDECIWDFFECNRMFPAILLTNTRTQGLISVAMGEIEDERQNDAPDVPIVNEPEFELGEGDETGCSLRYQIDDTLQDNQFVLVYDDRNC
ncbi:MAG: hypothetical protein NT040_05485 [Bacteroidetes bacterium]|nr:hypothetical protein [Bacteroidota bacterium]